MNTTVDINFYEKDKEVVVLLSSLDIRHIFNRKRTPDWNTLLKACGYSQEWFRKTIKDVFREDFNLKTYTKKTIFRFEDTYIISLCDLWINRYKQGDRQCTKENFSFIREDLGCNKKTLDLISKDFNFDPVEHFITLFQEAIKHDKIPSFRKYKRHNCSTNSK